MHFGKQPRMQALVRLAAGCLAVGGEAAVARAGAAVARAVRRLTAQLLLGPRLHGKTCLDRRRRCCVGWR